MSVGNINQNGTQSGQMRNNGNGMTYDQSTSNGNGAEDNIDNTAVMASVTSPDVGSGFVLEQELNEHQRWVWDCAFSADSAYLVTACSDHFARLWELATKTVIRQYSGHHRGTVCVALNDYSEAR